MAFLACVLLCSFAVYSSSNHIHTLILYHLQSIFPVHISLDARYTEKGLLNTLSFSIF